MTGPLARTISLAATLRNHKRLSTGLGLSDPKEIETAYEKDFAGLVTAVYQWFHESLQMDREYLDSTASQPQRLLLKGVLTIVRQQRHEMQHVGYRWASEAKEWRERIIVDAPSGVDKAAALKDGLLRELGDALIVLCDLAAAVQKDSEAALGWRARAVTEPRNEILAVCRNLGIGSPRNLDFIVRQFTTHPELRKALTPSGRAQVAEAVLMGSTLRLLSVEYTTLLDHFSLVNKSDAWALLLLAHGVEQRGHSRADTYNVLDRIWPIVSAST